jgi:hypothetical protein
LENKQIKDLEIKITNLELFLNNQKIDFENQLKKIKEKLREET